jgi:glycine/D-amino acid oxidase-like deaminating enzyme
LTTQRGRRVTIIGGGVMGLMTAYHAAPQAEAVTVLERSRVGDPAAASFGRTRSARNDYRDPEYARLAFEARRLWLEFQQDSGERPMVDCGEAVDVAEASGVDGCWYDLVADDEFILGPVPGADEVFAGAGWRGTGYKFAPWVGRVLAELALQQSTAYDIRRLI